MPTVACENITCGSPPCQSNPVQPNERPSYLNQCLALLVSWDVSLPPHSTTSRDLRRTIPLTGFLRLLRSERSPWKGIATIVFRCLLCFLHYGLGTWPQSYSRHTLS